MGLFSSFDLAQGYLQMAMEEEDIEKTAFCAGSSGLYAFTRMPFGLTKLFILETDASLKGLGAVLSQKGDDNEIRVIAYASLSLRPSEKSMRDYSSAKIELMALKWSICDKFKDYLLGSKFTVFTDNNPLCYIKSSKLGAAQIGIKV